MRASRPAASLSALTLLYALRASALNTVFESTSSVRSQECSVSFSHTRPNGKAWYTVNSNIQGGENLAYGFNDADSATEAWMNSPTHRDNILYPDFEKIAISVYVTDDGTAYWAQEFGY